MPKTLIHTQIELESEQIEKLTSMVEEEASVAEKVGGLAQTALTDLANGGMMLEPITMRALEQSIGQAIEGQGQILSLVEAGAGQADGRMVLKWSIDPTYMPQLEAMATFQECSVLELAQRTIDTCVDQGWAIGDVQPMPERVLMSKEDKSAIEQVLGGAFTNGTELSQLLKVALGMTSPFTEEPLAAK